MNAKRNITSVALVALTTAMTATVCAAERTWDGNSTTDNNFSTATNWVGDTAPAFDGTGILRVLHDKAGTIILLQ